MATLDRAPEGGARFPVDARLDGRTFVTFHVDLGVGDEAGEVTRHRMRLQAPWLPTSQAVQILPRTWQRPLGFTERPLCGCGGTQRTLVSLVERGGVRGQTVSVQAATTLMRAERRERGFRLITIRTSWSSAVSKVISRSTEKPAIL